MNGSHLERYEYSLSFFGVQVEQKTFVIAYLSEVAVYH